MGPTGRITLRLIAAFTVIVVAFTAGANSAGRRLHAQAPPAGTPGTEATIEGDLEVIIEDSDRGSRILYFLHAGDRRIALRFPSDPPELATGTRVRVHGRWDNDGALVVTSIETVRVTRRQSQDSLAKTGRVYSTAEVRRRAKVALQKAAKR